MIRYLQRKIEITQGDITQQNVDAIVNAANSSLLGGGGVDGAIHRAAGHKLYEECKTLGGCATGQAKITNGYDLTAKFVIHTVGPIYGKERGREELLLENCYKNCLKLAKERGLRSIAFPAISTGAYRFPKDKAAEIAVNAVRNFLEEDPDTLDRVVFVLFDEDNFQVYKHLINELNL